VSIQKVLNYERGLGKFRPLNTIVTYDDFDNGFNGWMDLTPNYVHKDYREHPGPFSQSHWGPAMISSGAMRWAATHGSMEGTYSLKLQTRPIANRYEQMPAPGSMSVALKRLSKFTKSRYLQVEAFYTYTPEQDREGLGEESIRAFGFYFDFQDKQCRYMPGVRYVNSVNGKLLKKWQYFKAHDVSAVSWRYGTENAWAKTGIDNIWFGERRPDGSADAFHWLPGGEQDLVYNESPDKMNWIYMRLLLDVERHEYVEFQSQDRIIDMRGLTPTLTDRYAGIDDLINPIFFIEADENRRVSLFLDSVVFSVD
jgi:hypothetical protein